MKGVSCILIIVLQIFYKNMAFTTYLLKNAILVLSRGVFFSKFAACPSKNDNYLTNAQGKG